MNYPRFLSVLLALTLLLCSLTGCQGKSSADSSSSTEEIAPIVYQTTDIFANPAFSVSTKGDFEKGKLKIILKQGDKSVKLTTPTLNGIDLDEETPTVQAFSGLMGYDGFCETHHAYGSSWSLRLYYAVIGDDATPLCIGAGYGYRSADDFVDVDEDGLFELVTTNASDSGTSTEVMVYHLVKDEIWKATVDKSSVLSDTASPVEIDHVISYGASRYEAETSSFLFRYPNTDNEETEVTLTYPESFNDSPYQPDPSKQIW